jgi:hypothetical protein
VIGVAEALVALMALAGALVLLLFLYRVFLRPLRRMIHIRHLRDRRLIEEAATRGHDQEL